MRSAALRTTGLLAGAVFLAGAQTALPPTRPRPAAPAPATAAPATATPAAPAHPTAPNPSDLKYPPAHIIEAPKVARFTLSNGLRLLLLEDHEMPVISGVAYIRTSSLLDPADKVGLASLTGMVMRSGGTRDMTGEELDRRLEDAGATMESSVDVGRGQVSFFALADSSAAVMSSFRDVLTNPVFRTDKVELAKVEIRGAISHRNDDAKQVAAREFRRLVYGDSSLFGRNIEYRHLDRIHRSDLQAFYKRYYFPKNVIVAISGDFETAKMKDQVEQLFSGWTVEQPAVGEFPKPADKPAAGLYFAKKTDPSLVTFVVGHQAGLARDKDYPALVVMANVLGNGSTSRLFRRVLVRMGTANSISATWDADFDRAGLFQIQGSSSKPISIVNTLKAIREEVENMRTGEVTAAELSNAKDRVLNGWAFSSDSRRKILTRILNLEYFGYPADFAERHQNAISAVTAADVTRVAKEYLKPADLTMLVVGNPDDFVPGLETLAAVHELDLTIPPAVSTPASPDTASMEQGKQILARLQQAVGGAEKLAAIKDYVVAYDVRYSAPAGGANATETDRWMLPGNMREESEGVGRTAIYSDGKSGWFARGRQSIALPPAQLKAMQGDLLRSYFTLLLSDRIAGRTVSALDTDAIEIAIPGGPSVTIAVNPDTGLPQSLAYQMPGQAGPPSLVQEIFTKFGEVGGIRVPFETTNLQNGNLFLEMVVKDFKVNTGLVLGDLERRP